MKFEIIQAENKLLHEENARLHKLLLLARERDDLQATSIEDLQKMLRELLIKNGNGLEQKNSPLIADRS